MTKFNNNKPRFPLSPGCHLDEGSGVFSMEETMKTCETLIEMAHNETTLEIARRQHADAIKQERAARVRLERHLMVLGGGNTYATKATQQKQERLEYWGDIAVYWAEQIDAITNTLQG